jgi:hypothetical protein
MSQRMSATIQNPKYELIDLGKFNEEYAGQTVRVVVNPSRAFRAAYNAGAIEAIFGAGDEHFVELLAAVMGLPADEVNERMNSLPPDAAQWLFLYTLDNFNGDKFETSIPPYLYRHWDDWVIKRVKAHAAQQKPLSGNETMPSAAEISKQEG